MKNRVASPAGFTLIELLITVGLIGVLSAIAVPSLLHARAAANEASAIGSLRTIISAQTSYASSAGRGQYASLLATLALPCPNSSGAYLSSDLSTDPSVKSGYIITMGPATTSTPGGTDCNGTNTGGAYYATAIPMRPGTTGIRSFSTAGLSTIFFSPNATPPTEAQISAGTALPIQ
jgi:prepilin-type N-terminal cleavage/methylation domain-containing protein